MKRAVSTFGVLLAMSAAAGGLTSCEPRPSSLPVHSLDVTKGFAANALFQFTISPDDGWMVYLEGLPASGFANELVALDLSGGRTVKFGLRTDESISLVLDLVGNRCWTSDSHYCLGPEYVRSKSNTLTAPDFVLDFGNPPKVNLTRQWSGQPVRYYPDLFRDGILTCSDCQRDSSERQFLEQQLPNKADLHFFSNMSSDRSKNLSGHNIASYDRRKIYYQKPFREQTTTLYEYDVDSKAERKVASFGESGSSCVTLAGMRLSHDQRFLAMQVNSGCAFSGAPELWIVNLETGKREFIPKHVYYDMHWLASSNRLYFYACEKPGACGSDDHLYYVDMEG